MYEFRDDDPRQKLPRSPHGSLGIYKVTFVLLVPGKNVFHEDLNLEKIMSSGESLLQLPPGVHLKATLSNENDSAEILFRSNSKGQIAFAETRIQAQNFVGAQQIAYDLVAPQLSYWSFLYDVAIDIAGYEVLEEATLSRRYAFGVLGRLKPFDKAIEGLSTPTYRRFFSAYREGMNSTNPFYQALSFYKVAEGVKAERIRKARRNHTYKKGDTPAHDNERFPKTFEELRFGDDDSRQRIYDELTKASFEPYLGQDFESVLKRLEELVRNAIAHLSQLDAVLDADRFNDVSVCFRAIPVMRYVAHQMLANDLRE